jgi:monoterpene epsilon-lactone hydrolase
MVVPGGLALSLLSLLVAQARDVSGLRPVAAAVMSPWADLAPSGESMKTRAEADPLMTRDSLATTARLYLGTHHPHDPLASPVYADLAGPDLSVFGCKLSFTAARARLAYSLPGTCTPDQS